MNLDAFDILSDFPELSQYDSVSNGHPNNGLLNHGHGPGPMLSQVGLLNFDIDTVANTQYLECLSQLVRKTLTDKWFGFSKDL